MWYRRKNIDQLTAGAALADGDRVIVAQGGSSEGKWSLLSALFTYMTGKFGTVAVQNANAVNFTGGSMTGVAIHGLSAPSAGGDAANKTYVDGIIAAQDAMVFKGILDCSANPNYPAADRGHTYRISVAGKIGGASGVNVEVGDTIICLTDSTTAGAQAAVGASWGVIQTNIDGAVVGPAGVTDDLPAIFDGTTGKLIKSKTYAAFKALLVLVKGDVGLGSVDNTSDATKNSAAATLTNKTLTAPVADTYIANGSPASKRTFDASGSTITIANGASASIVAGSGFLLVTDTSVTGDTGMYLVGGPSATLIAGGSIWVTPTTTPASGKASVQFDGTSSYKIYNNVGANVTFGVAFITTRTTF